MKQRLDQAVFLRGLTRSRSEAESWIRLGKVFVNKKVVTKSGFFVDDADDIQLKTAERYVSRAGLKLASVADKFGIDFADKIVLDVGSSTGGFTDYALQHGARQVIAVDVGTDQLHPSLHDNSRIELHEKTDIREVALAGSRMKDEGRNEIIFIQAPDVIVIDVSFISLREILPHISSFILHPSSVCLAMVKPQFEAGKHQASKGVIKNNAVRREILRDFEMWAKQYFVIKDKADSDVTGTRGNRERFYKLMIAKHS